MPLSPFCFWGRKYAPWPKWRLITQPLRRPLERRPYEIARKHCGSSPQWQISIANLRTKTGSTLTAKRFRQNLRGIIEKDETPFHRLELDDEDLLIARPRAKPANEYAPTINLPERAEDKAREIASSLGWDYYELRGNWLGFAQAESAKGNPPKNADAAFGTWAKIQKNCVKWRLSPPMTANGMTAEQNLAVIRFPVGI